MRWIAVALAFVTTTGCRHAPPAVAPPDLIVDQVRFEGLDALPLPAGEDFRDKFSLASGDALTSEAEQNAGGKAVEALQDQGYPYAQVSIAREPVDAKRVRLIVRAEPGTEGFFGRVDIAGNRRVDDAIIRRRIAYLPGDLFRRSAILLTQQRIGALGLFKSVEIRAHDIDSQPAEVPTLITVEEHNPWQWNASIGYAATERLGVDARVSHLNFLGSARRLDLEGRVSNIERSGGIALTQTDTWHPALSWSVQARQREIDERAFFALSRGGQGALTWQWTRELASTFSYAAAFERSNILPELEVLTGLQNGMLNAWSIDLDHRSPPLLSLPYGGSLGGEPRPSAAQSATTSPLTRAFTLHIEQAGGWMPGTFNYHNLIGDARVYREMFGERLRLAGRARYGAIDPATGEADIPMLKRFFLGGSEEMRGWSIYQVSPLSNSGTPTGGKSLFSLTGEARFPIFWRVRGAVFLEAGNVWQDPWTFGSLLYDAGPGLRFDTPYGLIRIDFGYQLKTLDGLRIDGQPQKHRWRINFGIGEAF